MDKDGSASRDAGSEQPGPDSSAWSREHDTTPLNRSSSTGASQEPASSPDDSPWARPSTQGGRYGAPHSGTPHSGTPHSGTPHSGTPHSGTPHSGTPQYGTPQYGAPQYGSPQ
jgi:hypothetical protein